MVDHWAEKAALIDSCDDWCALERIESTYARCTVAELLEAEGSAQVRAVRFAELSERARARKLQLMKGKLAQLDGGSTPSRHTGTP